MSKNPDIPYLPTERGFWRCPGHVLMAATYILMGFMGGIFWLLAEKLVECVVYQ